MGRNVSDPYFEILGSLAEQFCEMCVGNQLIALVVVNLRCYLPNVCVCEHNPESLNVCIPIQFGIF